VFAGCENRSTVNRTIAQFAWNRLHNTFARAGFGIASYRPPARTGQMKVISGIKRGREMLLTHLEANQLFSAVQSTSKLGGSIAEVGVYRGASARLIRNADSDRVLHLFDTFEGLPETTEQDQEFHLGQFQKGEFACSLEDVRQYVGSAHNIHFHKGIFPETSDPIKDERFSFVHIDVDIYASSLAALTFFYPRMVAGGIILSHDFATCAGPRKAITEFFAARPEPVIELPGDQCLIVKLAASPHPHASAARA
jgi:O-methyltransferase